MTAGKGSTERFTEGLFSADEWLRYTRHVQLANFGAAGQLKLKQAHVLVIGAGGLGCPSALYLAAAGVGTITLVDGDRVDISNLQRQIGFDVGQINTSKVLALQSRLLALNPEISVFSINHYLTSDNATEIIQPVDLVLDCTDNFATRYLINDTCYRQKKPWLMASIGEFSGQCCLFTPNTACFRCLFPDAPSDVADCNSAGVIGVLPGLLAMYQSCEAIKYLVGLPTPLKNNLLLIDALEVTQQKFELQKNLNCELCAAEPGDRDLTTSYHFQCAVEKIGRLEISIGDFNQKRDQPNTLVLDVRSSNERASFHIGGLHLPLAELEKKLPALDRQQYFLIYCQSGKRSLIATQLLIDSGFTRVSSLYQGLQGWLKENR